MKATIQGKKGTFSTTLTATALAVGLSGCGINQRQQHNSSDIEASTRNDMRIVSMEQIEVETPADVRQNILNEISLRNSSNYSFRSPFERGIIDKAGIVDIINIGKQIWDIISNNRGTTNITTDFVTAIPSAAKDMNDMSEFSDLALKSYQLKFKNYLGYSLAEITLTTSHQHGGKFQGRGQYLTSVSVYASHVWVTWATKINAAVKKVSISNVGGQDNPIGAAVLYVDLKVSTVVNSMSFNSIAQARGDKAEMFLSGLTKK